MIPMAKRISQRSSGHPRSHPPKISRKAQPPADRPFAPGYGFVGPHEGLGLLPWTWVERKMSRCRTFWVATIRHETVPAAANDPTSAPADRVRPHVMPVWGVWVNDAFYFSTASKSRKGQNLAANPACTITNDDGKEAVVIEGAASTLADPALFEHVAAVYKKKYKWDLGGMGEPIFKVTPAKVMAFIEKSFQKSATRWKL